MNDRTKLARLKIGLLTIWVFAALSFVPPFSGFGIAPLGRNLFVLLCIIHVIECGVFFRALRDSGKPLPGQFVQTMLYGVLHYRTLQLDAQERTPSTDV